MHGHCLKLLTLAAHSRRSTLQKSQYFVYSTLEQHQLHKTLRYESLQKERSVVKLQGSMVNISHMFWCWPLTHCEFFRQLPAVSTHGLNHSLLKLYTRALVGWCLFNIQVKWLRHLCSHIQFLQLLWCLEMFRVVVNSLKTPIIVCIHIYTLRLWENLTIRQRKNKRKC